MIEKLAENVALLFLEDEAAFGMMAICEIAFFLVLGYAKNRLVVRKRVL